MIYRLILVLVFFFHYTTSAQEKWWLDEPVRLLQTNLPLHMVPDYDPVDLVEQVEASGANTWLFNVGGIYAYYPTKLESHAINPFMNPKRDFAGGLVKLAKERNIKVIGRFDFSRFTEEIAVNHPEWCFRRTNGDTIQFNGLVTSCVFADYYQEYALKIIDEAMAKYDLDGLLINWWGNHGTNGYTGIPNGICSCTSCENSWSKISNDALPTEATPEYHKWHNQTKSELVSKVQDIIKKHSDHTALIMHHMTGDWTKGEGFTTETRTGSESNDWWLYQSSYYVSKYRNSYPDRALFNTVVDFIDYNFRFAPHRTQAIQTRMLQSMAHGAFPGFYMIGMPNQLDTTGAAAISYPFAVHKQNEQFYVKQESAANTIIIDDGLSEAMKGMINLLSEKHIPYKIIHENKLKNHVENTNVFITTKVPSNELMEAVKNGINLLSLGNNPPAIFANDVVKQLSADDMKKSYWLIQDSILFPKTSKHRIIFNPSAYTELKTNASSPIVLIPPARSTPPELVWTNMKISNKPGLGMKTYGKGKITYIPWNASEVYFNHATTSIGLMLEELLSDLGGKRQILTNAHPSVEISLMNQKGGIQLLHVINNTGQLHGSHNQMIPMSNINFKVLGEFSSVTLGNSNLKITTTKENGYTQFELPKLGAYELIILKE